jgi:PAS domain-containing protein
MKKLKTLNPKLNFKFTLEFTLFFIAIAVSIYLYFSNKFEDETLEHFRFKAEVFSSFLEQNPELFKDNKLVGREYLLDLMKFNEAYYLVIENDKGSIVDAINITYAEANFYVTTNDGEEISPEHSLYRVVLPVIASDVKMGNVYVGFKSIEKAAELRKKTLLTALFSIFILLAGIVFTYFLSTISFKPLKKLITALDKKGDLEAYIGLANARGDEIGVLAEKVKAIVAELDLSSMKVDNLNKKLNDVFREKIFEINKETHQRKRAELYLRNSEKQFKQLFENAPMGMVIISSRGLIISVNEAFCETLGYRTDEIIGGSVKNIFTDKDSVKYKPIYKLLKEAVDIDM